MAELVKINRVLTELDGLAEKWAVENGMREIAAKLSMTPDHKRVEGILAMLELAFAEGYYQAALTPTSETAS